MEEQGQAEKPVIQEGTECITIPEALVFHLDQEHQEKAHECLRKSGKITISFKEITLTKLSETLRQEVVAID